jgi:levansucrase
VADDEELTSWTLLPPLLDALEVNNELERPHHLYIDDRYYMFFTSGSADRFDPELADVQAIRPKGLYGFVADEFQGPYIPLNESGLVLANPLAAPAQTYSYQVLPGGYVFMFINYVNTGQEGIQDISDEWHLERFGGTLAPLLQIEITDEQTRLIGWPKDVFELIDELEQLPPPDPIEPDPVDPDPNGNEQPS